MQRRFDHRDFEAHNLAIRIQLQTLLRSGETTLYGRQYTYQQLKQMGMPVVRDRMFQILKELDPLGVASRRINLSSRPRGAYLVPGPNFVWSIDGHHKLSMYGIEIYAGIDAFSRYGQLSLLFSIFSSICWQIYHVLESYCHVGICLHVLVPDIKYSNTPKWLTHKICSKSVEVSRWCVRSLSTGGPCAGAVEVFLK